MTDEEKEAIEILNNTEWDGFMITIKNLIQKQDQEINKLNNVIDRMAEELYSNDYDTVCQECCKECERDLDTLNNCIKEYFMKENKQQ